MARPGVNDAGYQQANKRFRDTMLKKHGSIEEYHKWMQHIGAKGGKAGNTGGFYANPDLASKAGRLGGLKSRRGKSLKTAQRIKQANEMHDNGATLREIAEALGVAISTACNYLKEN